MDPRSLPRHPRTGLRALGMGKRGPIWPIMGGSQPTGEPATPPAAPAVPPAAAPPAVPSVPATPAVPATGADGYPADTPVAEMTPEQQAAYHKAQSRRWEQRAKERGDYDDLKAKAAEFDKLKAANQTEHEKAVAEARAEADKAARAEVTSKFTARLVEAEIKAAAAGKLTPEQIAALLPTLNHSAFLNAENEPDAVKVTTLVQSLTPVTQPPKTATDLGQGKRPVTAATGTAAGAEMFAERRKKPSTTSTT